uniref:Uncharacterized protein n=1 Tax=Megaselia scalaris TaxID=36166 RepID=T1GLZ3_MEGSC
MATWLKQDAKALQVIVTTITEEHKLHITNCDDAHEMWQKLESIYEMKSESHFYLSWKSTPKTERTLRNLRSRLCMNEARLGIKLIEYSGAVASFVRSSAEDEDKLFEPRYADGLRV